MTQMSARVCGFVVECSARGEAVVGVPPMWGLWGVGWAWTRTGRVGLGAGSELAL
jgi:hypothetical protein